MSMTWLGWPSLALVSLGSITIGALGLVARGRSRWLASTHALIAELEAARLPAAVPRYDAHELEGLPAPVQRYFQAALKDGQHIVTAATIELRGSFNLSPTGECWRPFSSVQRVATHRPGFVWDGHVALAPGITVDVHDAYIAGRGILKPSVLGLYALADVHGAGEIARGELMRYVAEAAWYPTALLPSQGVRWKAVDDRSAMATLEDGPLSVSMRVGFDSAGMIESARFEARGMAVGDKIEPTPWEGRWSDYREHLGMRLPMTCVGSGVAARERAQAVFSWLRHIAGARGLGLRSSIAFPGAAAHRVAWADAQTNVATCASIDHMAFRGKHHDDRSINHRPGV